MKSKAEAYMVRRLSGKENGRTQSLYEEVFSEDSAEFVEYYYRRKAAENQIYVAEHDGELVSMLHLNPYRMNICGAECDTNYIVAVATKEEHRHRGLMRKLIAASLCDMYEKREPFAFLMPASEAIYRPFDFRFVYQKPEKRLETAEYDGDEAPELRAAAIGNRITCRPAEREDAAAWSAFAEKVLSERTAVHAVHTEAYFYTLLEEQAAVHGQIMLLTEDDRIVGYFYTALEGSPEVREPVSLPEYEEELFGAIAEYFREYEEVKLVGASIMARIVNLETFLKNLRSETEQSFRIRITDQLIKENSGGYEIHIGTDSCEVCRTEIIETAEECNDMHRAEDLGEMGIAEFTEWIFAQPGLLKPVFLNEVV